MALFAAVERLVVCARLTSDKEPKVFAVHDHFELSFFVDVGCDGYFALPVAGVTDGDSFTLYVRMRSFEFREDEGRPRVGQWYVGPWSDEVPVSCERQYFGQ